MADISQQQIRDRLGNIDQIRDLIFGEQIIEYQEKFTEYEERLSNLESDFSSFKSEIIERMDRTQISFNKDLTNLADSLEKKIKYLSLVTHEEASKIQEDIESNYNKNFDEIENLKNTINTQNNYLTELLQGKTQLEEDLQSLKKQVFAELEKSVDNLQENKVSRTVLAEVLFELCLQIKGDKLLPKTNKNTDFLLPE